MQKGKDIAAQSPGLFVVHHNLPGSIVPAHMHPEHHLIIPLQGEVSVTMAEKTLTCGPGRMVYIAPDTEHVFKSAREKGERLICMIGAAAWKKAEASRHASTLLPASQLCKELLFYLLLNPGTRHVQAFIDAFVRTVADILAAPPPETSQLTQHAGSNVNRPELRKAVAIAHEHFAAELSVAELARRAGLSLRNLNRLFQVEMGITPKQLLTALKIEKAKELLLSGSTVTETAFAVGYSSLSQFIASFRQLTGQLPSEFAALSGFGQKPQ